MPKKYAVDVAELSCEYGSQPSYLKVPSHRHIKVNGYELGNEGDISPYCLGCFGSCSSPYRLGDTQVSKLFGHIQEVRASNAIELEPCQVDVEIPWQNTQPEVYAAKCKALLEDGWTVCHKGYGIIAIVDSGQGFGGTNLKIIQKLRELELAVDRYMRDNQIPEKYRDKLITSILLWNGYDYNPWDTTSDANTIAFHEYLKKDNPALYNFFEREISITDSTGKTVDLNYFIGLTKSAKDNVSIEDSYIPTIAFEMDKFYAYIDAYNVNRMYYDEMKDLSWSEMINSYYNLDGSGESKAESRYTDYVYFDTFLAPEDMSVEEKAKQLRKTQAFNDANEEVVQIIIQRYTAQLEDGLEEERNR